MGGNATAPRLAEDKSEIIQHVMQTQTQMQTHGNERHDGDGAVPIQFLTPPKAWCIIWK